MIFPTDKASQASDAIKAAIQTERKRWESIFIDLPANIAVTRGPDHVFEFANETYLRTVRKREVIGKPLRDVLPEIVAQGILELTNQVYRTGEAYSHSEAPAELEYGDGTKETRYYTGSMIPLKNSAGEVTGLLNYQYDVTDHVIARRQIELANSRLSFALESSQLGLWDWNSVTEIGWFSDNYGRNYGYEKLPHPWGIEQLMQHMHPDDKERCSAYFARAYRDPTILHHEIEYRVIWPDGSIHWLRDKGIIERDTSGKIVHSAGSTMDNTKLKQIELDLQSAKDVAESASKAKSQFLATLSHEIRTPLTAIVGFAELLGRPSEDTERAARFADGIVRNSEALVGLIDDLMDLSKIEAGGIQIHESYFELALLLEEIEATLHGAAAKKGLSLYFQHSFAHDLSVKTDRSRLRQILLNVVGNAIKFTDAGHVILETQIEQNADENGLHHLRLLVRDTGIGISEDETEHIFQPFRQAGTFLSRRQGGSGLGLAISRQLACAMGGDVRLIESVPRRGSTFEIELRVQMFEMAEIPKRPKTNSNRTFEKRLSGFKFLLAEDFPDVQATLASLLEAEGARVDIAENGLEVLERVQASLEPYHAVLMDLQMPVMDGYTATRKLRESGFHQPIIAVTAHASKSEAEMYKDSGFSLFVCKPIGADHLVGVIQKCLSQENVVKS